MYSRLHPKYILLWAVNTALVALLDTFLGIREHLKPTDAGTCYLALGAALAIGEHLLYKMLRGEL
ncbi:MAG: hypothetical protein Q4D50_12680 [Eubacteriales bacterium]|nr:hypothetical protein [Eubacteriales bacterium]